MELKTMIDSLSDLGCGKQQGETAKTLYRSGQMDELIRHLRKCRCGLVEEMHESQRKVDRMDQLIRKAVKESGNRTK